MKRKMEVCKCSYERCLEEYVSEYESMKKDATWDWREATRLLDLAKLVIKTHEVYCICKEQALHEGMYDEEHHDHEDYAWHHTKLKHDGHIDASTHSGAYASTKM